MAFVHGKGSLITIDDSGGTPRAITGADSVQLTQSGNPAEVTALGDASKAFLAGLKDGKVSVSGSWDDTAAVGNDIVLGGIVGGAAGTILYEPKGTGTSPNYSFEALCTSYDIQTSVSDKVTFSADFQVTGAITRA